MIWWILCWLSVTEHIRRANLTAIETQSFAKIAKFKQYTYKWQLWTKREKSDSRISEREIQQTQNKKKNKKKTPSTTKNKTRANCKHTDNNNWMIYEKHVRMKSIIQNSLGNWLYSICNSWVLKYPCAFIRWARIFNTTNDKCVCVRERVCVKLIFRVWNIIGNSWLQLAILTVMATHQPEYINSKYLKHKKWSFNYLVSA